LNPNPHFFLVINSSWHKMAELICQPSTSQRIITGTVVACDHAKHEHFHIDDGTGVACILIPPSLRLRTSSTATQTNANATRSTTKARTTGKFIRKRRTKTRRAPEKFPFPAMGALVKVWAQRVRSDHPNETPQYNAINYVNLQDWNNATLHMLHSCTDATPCPSLCTTPAATPAVTPADKQRAVDELLGNLNAEDLFFSQESVD
jgi:hypothetical protein